MAGRVAVALVGLLEVSTGTGIQVQVVEDEEINQANRFL
jgi:hypothetical protein